MEIGEGRMCRKGRKSREIRRGWDREKGNDGRNRHSVMRAGVPTSPHYAMPQQLAVCGNQTVELPATNNQRNDKCSIV